MWAPRSQHSPLVGVAGESQSHCVWRRQVGLDLIDSEQRWEELITQRTPSASPGMDGRGDGISQAPSCEGNEKRNLPKSSGSSCSAAGKGSMAQKCDGAHKREGRHGSDVGGCTGRVPTGKAETQGGSG